MTAGQCSRACVLHAPPPPVGQFVYCYILLLGVPHPLPFPAIVPTCDPVRTHRLTRDTLRARSTWRSSTPRPARRGGTSSRNWPPPVPSSSRGIPCCWRCAVRRVQQGPEGRSKADPLREGTARGFLSTCIGLFWPRDPASHLRSADLRWTPAYANGSRPERSTSPPKRLVSLRFSEKKKTVGRSPRQAPPKGASLV